jgi:hypothetical protein
MRESSVMTQNGPSLALEVLHKQLAALTCTLLGVRESDFGSPILEHRDYLCSLVVLFYEETWI